MEERQCAVFHHAALPARVCACAASSHHCLRQHRTRFPPRDRVGFRTPLQRTRIVPRKCDWQSPRSTERRRHRRYCNRPAAPRQPRRAGRTSAVGASRIDQPAAERDIPQARRWCESLVRLPRPKRCRCSRVSAVRLRGHVLRLRRRLCTVCARLVSPLVFDAPLLSVLFCLSAECVSCCS